MSIPSNLNIVYRSLQGYRKSLIRFYPDRSGVINSGDVLRFTFPKEIMSLDTLMKYFEFTSTASQSATATRQGTHFPRNSASIIDSLTIFINGQVFENIVSYNHLFNIIMDNTSGFNYNCSGIRSLECVDPSVLYTLNATTEAITAAAQGTATGTTDAQVCDTKRPLQIRNWIGFLNGNGNNNAIIDLTNVELVCEIRYASANIMWKGINATSPTEITPNYSIDNYYMTIQKITFDDDVYQRTLNSLKASGNYTLVFKTYSTARSASIAKSSNPTLQFSTTAKYLTKLYLTCMDKDYDTMTYILNQGTSSTTITPVFSVLMANTGTNIVAYNQSRYFQKNSTGLREAQVEVNGIPVYPFPQPVHLIKNNNFDAFDLEGNLQAGDYPGLQSLEQWTKYAFVQAVSFEHKDAWKNDRLITGYPNPNGNLLTIKWSPTFDSGNSNNTILLGYAERVVMAKFSGNSVSIEY
jgi:hypothetical protein